jgi:hypothetical protein
MVAGTGEFPSISRSAAIIKASYHFSIPGYLNAPVGSYLAACSLSRLDFHQQVDDDFSVYKPALADSMPQNRFFL